MLINVVGFDGTLTLADSQSVKIEVNSIGASDNFVVQMIHGKEYTTMLAYVDLDTANKLIHDFIDNKTADLMIANVNEQTVRYCYDGEVVSRITNGTIYYERQTIE